MVSLEEIIARHKARFYFLPMGMFGANTQKHGCTILVVSSNMMLFIVVLLTMSPKLLPPCRGHPGSPRWSYRPHRACKIWTVPVWLLSAGLVGGMFGGPSLSILFWIAFQESIHTMGNVIFRLKGDRKHFTIWQLTLPPRKHLSRIQLQKIQRMKRIKMVKKYRDSLGRRRVVSWCERNHGH